MFNELPSRDREGACATGQPQGVGPEAYLNGASQGELVVSLSKEHPRTPGRTAISAVAASDSSKIRARKAGNLKCHSRRTIISIRCGNLNVGDFSSGFSDLERIAEV